MFRSCLDDTCSKSCKKGTNCSCDALREYANACAKKHVYIHWNEHRQCAGLYNLYIFTYITYTAYVLHTCMYISNIILHIYSARCPKGQVYAECKTRCHSCSRFWNSINSGKSCRSKHCRSGCQCPQGTD